MYVAAPINRGTLEAMPRRREHVDHMDRSDSFPERYDRRDGSGALSRMSASIQRVSDSIGKVCQWSAQASFSL